MATKSNKTTTSSSSSSVSVTAPAAVTPAAAKSNKRTADNKEGSKAKRVRLCPKVQHELMQLVMTAKKDRPADLQTQQQIAKKYGVSEYQVSVIANKPKIRDHICEKYEEYKDEEHAKNNSGPRFAEVEAALHNWMSFMCRKKKTLQYATLIKKRKRFAIICVALTQQAPN